MSLCPPSDAVSLVTSSDSGTFPKGIRADFRGQDESSSHRPLRPGEPKGGGEGHA